MRRPRTRSARARSCCAFAASGEIWAVLDTGEVKMSAGDVLIQRGTGHAWSNRSDAPCRIAFVLIGAKPVNPGGKTLNAVG